MIKTKTQSPSLAVLKDCHSLSRLLKDGAVRKLALAIEFEHYHFRKKLDMSQIHKRFEYAMNTLLSYNVIVETEGLYSLNLAEYELFFNSMLFYK